MNRTKPKITWAEANQAYLVAEFARLREQLGSKREEQSAETVRAVKEVATAMAAVKTPAIDRLTELVGLSVFEREFLLLCAGVEMDSKLAARCAEAQGHPQRTYVTYGLALAALPDSHWSALTPSRPLRRLRLVTVEAGHGLTSAPVHIDERVLHYLAGVNLLDARLQSMVQFSPFPEWIAEDHKTTAAQAMRTWVIHSQDPPVLHLCGDDPQGQEDVAALVAHACGRQLYVLRTEDIPGPGPDLDQFALLWEREALLLPGALLVQWVSGGLTPSARHLIDRLPAPLILASREPVRLNRALLRLDVDKPAPAEQKRLWEKALGPVAASFNGAMDTLAEQFRLSAKTIFHTAALAAADAETLQPGDLWRVCRSLARPKLEDLSQRIVPLAGWEDLVLPDLQMKILRQLASQVRHRMQVYETWGFSAKGRRGLGVSALFTGDSGTGKTLAAEVLARELGLDLYRIDLAAVVSKYIGETEKNLKHVFDAAEEGGVLLLFDEADALFGKRGEVKDSHDRYANIEVGYLLQRMEAYQGLAILTTNLKSSLDKAFQRRLRFTVNFPFPDAGLREAIWRKVFPVTAPTNGLDNRKLAQLNVAGGSIHNIALNAAFMAAQAEKPVEMRHLVEAAKLEAEKIERPLSQAEIRGWA
ncbi:MAG TPA: ATP-binding protein [Terriglobales bacterium]|jgi:hypothetical protein|nr:ATP-binding protein [Terriglobales bacterium]